MNHPRCTDRDDGGYVLPLTVLVLVLLGYVAWLTAGTFAVLLRSSVQERLVVEERFAARSAEQIVDAWMADPATSKEITGQVFVAASVTSVSDPLSKVIAPADDIARFSPVGGRNCTETVCWQVTEIENVSPAGRLRGGEAQQQLVAVTIRIDTGCFSGPDDCQRTATMRRVYERAVFSQYQLHYDTNTAPAAALYGGDGNPDDPRCFPDRTNPAAGVCDDPEAVYGDDGIPDSAACSTDPRPADVSCDGLSSDTVIVLTSEDTLNGPVRTTLTEVLYCGAPSLRRVEVSGTQPDPATLPLKPVDPDCPTNLKWLNATGQPLIPATTLTVTDLLTSGALRWGGNLDLPDAGTAPAATLSCDTVDFDHLINLANQIQPNPAPGACPRNLADGDIISPTSPGGDITIHKLVLDGSVTVHTATGNIIICGEIEAKGLNPAGGPNVVALIAAAGNVILDPSGGPATPCAAGLASGSALTEVDNRQNLDLTGVAVLAPQGAVYTRNWHLPHSDRGGPTLTIEGSVASRHLGLYGIPDDTGDVTAGWAKQFTYPADFWRARPPWWPNSVTSEWTPT